MKTTLQRFDDNLLEEVLRCLDPFSKYQLGTATRGADLHMTGIVASSLLSEALPSSLVPRNAREIFTEDYMAVPSDAIWKRKGAVVKHITSRFRYDPCVRDSTNLAPLLLGKSWNLFGGSKMRFSPACLEIIEELIREVAQASALISEAARRWLCALKDVKYACERLNLRTACPPDEDTFDAPSVCSIFLPDEMTLNEIASIQLDQWATFEEMVKRHDEGDRVLVDSWTPQWPSYQDQVQMAVKVLEYLRYRIKESPEQVSVLDNKFRELDDPYDDIGSGNTIDGDWDDWVAHRGVDPSLEDFVELSSEEQVAERGKVDTELALLIEKLTSLSVDGADKYPAPSSFKLDRNEFFRSFQRIIWDYRTNTPCSPSATMYLQKAVEDFAFGIAVKPFLVDHPDIEGSMRCRLVLGEHGTTMFSLDDNLDCLDSDDSDYEMEEDE